MTTPRSTDRPRLLDLFCCEGGASTGYARAGFDVTGVDLDKNRGRHYPFTFVHADALAYVAEHGHEFDVIAASPPCQAYSITKHTHGNEHPELIEPTRAALIATGRPYVIENVPGAPLQNPLTLCGSMFHLQTTDKDGSTLALRRHRLFESNVYLMAPGPCRHDPTVKVGGVYGGGSTDRNHAEQVRRGGYTPDKTRRAELMGMPWATQHGLNQAIPPAYTEHIGRQLLDHITATSAA